MALSHFTLPECPNPDCPSNDEDVERAVGDPVSGTWFCFECRKTGKIEYTLDDTGA